MRLTRALLTIKASIRKAIHLSKLFGILLLPLALQGCLETTRQNRHAQAPITIEDLDAPQQAARGAQAVSREGSQVRHKIALLLPLSGPHQRIGQAMLQAAQMSMYGNSRGELELLIHDTKGTPAQAIAAAQTALDEGAELLIGPVFASSSVAVAPLAAQRNVAVLSFSNDRQITQNGIFSLGFSPADEIHRLLDVASRAHVRRIGAILPKNSYGDLLDHELKRTVQYSPVELAFVTHYKPGTSDFGELAAKIISSNIDGLLIPEGGAQLSLLASSLKYYDVDFTRVRLLGTGQWDTPDIMKNANVEGGWFVGSPVEKRREFEREYQTLYSETPPRLATLAYDAVSLATLLAQTHPQQPFSFQNLTQTRGFSGVDGVFRLTPQGTTQRQLAVFEVSPYGLQTVTPAANAF